MIRIFAFIFFMMCGGLAYAQPGTEIYLFDLSL